MTPLQGYLAVLLGVEVAEHYHAITETTSWIFIVVLILDLLFAPRNNRS